MSLYHEKKKKKLNLWYIWRNSSSYILLGSEKDNSWQND
uniref:Uncharacterized protein n=1 Tax=Anguilla anguilla TaxID=7936 RepID=A0A0E9UHH5_ANGAN